MKTQPYELTAHGMNLIAGSAGSGPMPAPTGNDAADEMTRTATLASRYAGRDHSASSHEQAGDLHYSAALAHKEAGNSKQADQHFEKAASHYRTAKMLATNCDAADAGENNADFLLRGKPTVPNPKGSESSFSDKGDLEKYHERNLSESGGRDSSPAPSSLTLCPACQKSFYLGESVGQGTSLACPYCHQLFPKAA